MRGDSADLIDVYRTKWQAGSEVLSNVGELMWDCGKAAAADHLNCMDRGRDFVGHQFEGHPHPFPRIGTDWGVRNCFTCGQPGHVARFCRGGIGNVGGPPFLGRGVQQRAWPYPEIRPIHPIHPREAAYYFNRVDGPQGWQQQVPGDFPDPRQSGNRNVSYIQNRQERSRERHSGRADYDAHANLSISSRASEENHRKLASRRPVVKRNDVPRKDTEDNDARFRAVANGSSGEEGGRDCDAEDKATTWHADSGGFELKPQTDRANRLDTSLDRSRSQVRVLSGSDEPTRAPFGNAAENRSLERDSATHLHSARLSQAVKGDRGDSDLENGEFVSEGNTQWAASGNHLPESDVVISKSTCDGNELVLEQALTNPSSVYSRAVSGTKSGTENERSLHVETVTVKNAAIDEGEVRAGSDNSCSLRTESSSKATGPSVSLERSADGEVKEGAGMESAGNETGNRGICQVASQNNESPAGPVQGSTPRNLDCETNLRGDCSGVPLAASDIVERITDCTASQDDFMFREANVSMQSHAQSSSPPAFKARDSQRPHNAFGSSAAARDPNASSGWRGRAPNGCDSFHDPSERAESVKLDCGGFAESVRDDRSSSLTRRSEEMPELRGQQFQPEHMTRSDRSKGWSPLEQIVNGLQRTNTEAVLCEEQYNIDARVEKLMLNFPLVQGREQDSVADALMAASQRITEDDFEGGTEGASTVPRVDLAVKSDIPAGCDAGVTPASIVLQSPGRVKLPVPVSNTNSSKYPTAGGDWRLTQTEKQAETGGVSGSKVPSWRKEVMNFGVSLSDVSSGVAVDPRKLAQGGLVPHHRKLEVPSWAVPRTEKPHDGPPLHHPHPTEPSPGKVRPSPHVGGPSETTKGTQPTPRPSKASNVRVSVQNDMFGSRGKEAGSSVNPLRKPGQTRTPRKKPETTNTSWRGASSAAAAIQTAASLTVQVAHGGATFDNELLNGTYTDLSCRTSGRSSVDMVCSSQQPVEQSAGDPHDLSLLYCSAPAVSSKSSKDLASGALRKHELHLEHGVWHFLDAAGHERGPFLLSALQGFVAEGGLPPGVSVFRKSDNVWVSVSHLLQYFDARGAASASTRQQKSAAPSKDEFHSDHPQYLGYTNGKLHELVMKSFRGSFAGFFNDALDVWWDTKRSAPPSEVDTAFGEEAEFSTGSAGPNSLKRSFGSKKFGKNSNDRRADLESFRTQHENYADREISDLPSPALQSPSVMLNLDQSALDLASPCDVKSSGMRKDQAGDYAPLGSETISSNVDGSHLAAEHSFWSEGRRFVEDGPPSRRNVHPASVVEVDGSNSSTASQVAVHATVATSTGTMAKEVASDQDISETGVGYERQSSLDAGGSSAQRGWAWLPPKILSKIMLLLRGDPKLLAASMATCQSWRDCGQNTKDSTKHADLSGRGDSCTDAIIRGLLGFGGGKLRRVTLDYCENVSSKAVGRLLKAYPTIREVSITGCSELRVLIDLYPKVRFLGNPLAVPNGLEFQRHILMNSKRIGKSTGGKREHGDDGYSGCSLDDMGYRDKSTEGSESPGTRILEPLSKDADFRDAKRFKSNPGFGFRNGFRAGRNDDQQSVGTGDEKESLSRRRKNSHGKRKPNIKKLQSGPPGSSKKAVVSVQKTDSSVKEALCNLKPTESLEKALGRALKLVMDADSDNLIYRSANEGGFTKPGQVDFPFIQKRLKTGHYEGKDGVKAFKEDLLKPLRIAFRLDHDSPTYKSAGRVFKFVHQVFQQLDTLLSQPSNRELADGQSRGLGSCVTSTRTLMKSRGSKDLVIEKHHSTKRSWDSVTGSGRIVKRKVVRAIASRSEVDRDSDLQGSSDRDADREPSRSRLRRNQWTESEAGSSDEEDIDEALYEEPEEEDTESSGSDIASKSGLEDEEMDDYNDASESDDTYSGFGEGSSREWWGARMTKAAMVPPLTRKYEVIEEYRFVEDVERVAAKMKVSLPDDYDEKLKAANEKAGDRFAHLDVPDLKEHKPRKRLGEEVVEQEVYGIDPFTYNLLLNTMPADTGLFTDRQKQLFIEEKLLRTLNREVSSFTNSGKAPMEYPLEKVITHICSDVNADQYEQAFCRNLLKNMKSHLNDKYVAYRKGLGVVCNKQEGFDDGDFVVEFFGEVYPPWRWFEKQDGIRSLQKKDKDPAPEFYNIVLERPKGDAFGYDVLVVDAMHKANFASRLCHSCRPNCEAKVTAVNGKYMIGVYTLRKIEFGEELTFDYCCVTESKEEHDSSVCLCGSQGCKGSFLCYTGPGAYDEVLKEHHGILDRHNLLLQACTSGGVTFREQEDLKKAGLGPSLLDGLPNWVIKYAAGIVSYMNFERTKLPEELLKADLQRHSGLEPDRQDIEVQTEGVYNQRLQNLAITLDKVRHILTKLYDDDASTAPPPLRMLEPHELVDFIWTGKDSVVGELLQCMAVHAPEGLEDLTRQIQEHNPPAGGDIEENLHKSLLWLRDTLRKVPATCVGRHDAAADLIHLYAYTKHFFTNYDYGTVESKPILIYACDLGPKHSGSGPYCYKKSYSKNYIWGQLISWFRQTSNDPGASLVQDRRGCLMLPDISSCYAKTIQHDFRCGYSNKDRKRMILHMESQPQKKWTRKFTPELWNFKSDRGLFGSPMLDAAVSKTKLNKECIQWLKNRDTVFHGPWDEE